MRILFIGGTGVISSACSQLAIEHGFKLYLFNRGKSLHPAPGSAGILRGDIRDLSSAKTILNNLKFDVVVDWIAFTPQHIKADIALFRDRTDQFVFISSASVYQTPPVNLPVTESTPLANPFWEYSRKKIACEELLVNSYRESQFPFTIVRPSHTYDKTLLPMHGGYTIIDRMRKGQKVVVHGDGSSLWVMTHHRDFAKGFVGLLGNNRAIGEIFHITSDELLTWNQIFNIVARAAGTTADIVHIPSEIIAKHDSEWGDSLLGDKTHSMIFDNTKIRRLVPDFKATIPFRQGAAEIIDWYDTHPDQKVIDHALNDTIDKMIKNYTAH